MSVLVLMAFTQKKTLILQKGQLARPELIPCTVWAARACVAAAPEKNVKNEGEIDEYNRSNGVYAEVMKLVNVSIKSTKMATKGT